MSTEESDGHAEASCLPSQLGTHLSLIQDWRDTAVEPDNRSSTSRLTQECISIFTGLLKQLSSLPELEAKTYRRLKVSCSLLILWDKAHGIGAGNLDDALSRSRSLRQSILEPLRNMGRVIIRKLLPLVEQDYKQSETYRGLMPIIFEAETDMYDGHDTDSESEESDICESSDDNLGNDDWCDIADDMNTDIQCLLELAPVIESPIWDGDREVNIKELHMSKLEPHATYGDKIQNRFPKADARLVERLALANWERFLATKSAREHNTGTHKDNSDARLTIGDGATTVAPSELNSKFNDSGLGSSIQTVSVYAETIMSYTHDDGHNSTKIPPLPQEAKKGEPFQCVACGQMVLINNNSAWKKHLYRDLCPWICLYDDCVLGAAKFMSREVWIHHLGYDHKLAPGWKPFRCPLCHLQTGEGKAAISRHLSSHMEEISLSVLPITDEFDLDTDTEYGTLSEISSRDKDSIIPALSSDFREPQKIPATTQNSCPEPQNVLPPALLSGVGDWRFEPPESRLNLSLDEDIPKLVVACPEKGQKGHEQESEIAAGTDSPILSGLLPSFQDQTLILRPGEAPDLALGHFIEAEVSRENELEEKGYYPVILDPLGVEDQKSSSSSQAPEPHLSLLTISSDDVGLSSGRPTPKKSYPCPECNKSFKLAKDQERHFQSKHCQTWFSCRCGYRSSRKDGIKRHVSTMKCETSASNGVYSCICENFTTTLVAEFLEHIKSHTRPRGRPRKSVNSIPSDSKSQQELGSIGLLQVSKLSDLPTEEGAILL